MLKRANKITALLVAVATSATVLPATTASAATTRLETQDGEFTQAFSYAEGKFVYNGYRTDDDDTAIYYNDGENEEEVEDYDDYDFDDAEKYGTKYVTVEDDGDTYLLDLSTGKIDDDESLEDKEDNAKSKLKTNLKKADRYEDFKDSKADVDSDDNTFERILKNKYGEVWYKYQVTGDSDATDYMANGVKKYIGVVNEDNKYLDLSYVANIYAYSPSKQKTVKFDNFGDSEEFDKDGNEATLKLVDTKIIDQDDDYLYAITTVKVEEEAKKTTDKEEVVETENVNAAADSEALKTAKAELEEAKTKTEAAKTELDKANKAKDDALVEDENADTTELDKAIEAAKNAYETAKSAEAIAQAKVDELSKTTEDTDKKDDTTTTDTTGYQYFFQKISKAQGDKKDGAYTPKSVASYQINIGGTYKDGDADDAATELEKVLNDDEDVINVQVKDGMIHVAELDDSDTVKVYKLKYKKDKIDTDDKENVDAYIVLKDGDTDEDIVDTSDDDAKPYSVDINGNLWILGKGKIFKYDGDEFKELYTCDRSINNLDVYDDDNLIAWEMDDEVFVVLQDGKGGKNGGETEDPDGPTKTDKVGWDKNEDGTWSFYDATGVQVKASWVNVQGTWYYLKEDGIMATGWLQEGGNWYYLNASGAMQTGWLNDNGTWYYLQSNGAMKTGWLNDNGTWYYLKASGAMAANETIDG